MNLKAKKTLIINLSEQTFEVKSFSDLNKYIGGVGLGIKLFQMFYEKNPIIFSVGPLNGFFPFTSKTSIVFENDGSLEDVYLGGTLASRIKFSGLDAIVLNGKCRDDTVLDIREMRVHFEDSKKEDIKNYGLPGKRSVLEIKEKNNLLLDDYFTSSEGFLGNKLKQKNIAGIVTTATEAYTIKNFAKYTSLYKEILKRQGDMLVEKSVCPSCVDCPLGCKKSRKGEIGGNILVHSLVACEFAEKIYGDLGIVFACLNTLGYDYTHEDIENLPLRIEEILK